MNPTKRNIARSEILGVVLCGGRSRRFGSPKPFHVFEGATLVERALETIRPLVAEVCLAVGESTDLPWPSVPLIRDRSNSIGPMGGIEAAGRYSDHDWLLVLPVDVPFMTSDVLSVLIRAARQGHPAVVGTDSDGQIHPLCALYHRSALDAIGDAIARREYGLQHLLSSLHNVRYVTLPDECLRNANRPEDLL